MSATNRITLVLRPNQGASLEDLKQYAKLGMPVGVGRSLGVITSASEGDVVQRAEQLENQVILAEAAMRRGVLLTDKDCQPALRRVIDQVPKLYREVADAIKQAALAAGDDESTAEEAASQAICVLVVFKQRLEEQLEPGAHTKSMHIDDRVRMVSAEPAYLTVVFKLQSLNDAKPLIRLLPYGKKAMGTEALVHGFSTGNLMEGVA
jgi:hypothetical protein